MRRAIRSVALAAAVLLLAPVTAAAAAEPSAAPDPVGEQAAAGATASRDGTSLGTPSALISRSNISATTLSECGDVKLLLSLSSAANEVPGRLPIRIYATATDRGLARTLVRTISSLTEGSVRTAPLFDTAPSGLGPGVQLDIEWTGGTDSFTTEPYVDQCPGRFFATPPSRVLDTRIGIGAPVGRQNVGLPLQVDPLLAPAVPATGVTAIALNLTVTEPAFSGFVTAYPCGATRPTASNLNFVGGQTVANLVVVDVTGRAATGKICLFASAATHLVADVTGYFVNDQDPLPIGGGFVSLDSPQRALDTRTGAPASGGGTVRRLQLGGQFDIPSTGVTGVAMNITAVDAAADGFVTAYPCGAEPPTASNVNYVVGRATPNAAIIGLSDSGELCIFTLTDVHVIVDVLGFYSPAARGYMPANPMRLVDTRTTFSFDTRPAARQKLEPNTVTPLRMLFADSMLVVNATVTEPESDGFLTVFPCDRPLPATSNLNFSFAETVANTTFVRSNGTSEMCVYSTARTHFVADLQGIASNFGRFPAS